MGDAVWCLPWCGCHRAEKARAEQQVKDERRRRAEAAAAAQRKAAEEEAWKKQAEEEAKKQAAEVENSVEAVCGGHSRIHIGGWLWRDWSHPPCCTRAQRQKRANERLDRLFNVTALRQMDEELKATMALVRANPDEKRKLWAVRKAINVRRCALVLLCACVALTSRGAWLFAVWQHAAQLEWLAGEAAEGRPAAHPRVRSGERLEVLPPGSIRVLRANRWQGVWRAGCVALLCLCVDTYVALGTCSQINTSAVQYLGSQGPATHFSAAARLICLLVSHTKYVAGVVNRLLVGGVTDSGVCNTGRNAGLRCS